nr:MAG TPA: putative tail component [Caudoviricetes sp.]
MANTVSVDQLANVIMQGLTEYADAQSDMVKQSVKDVSKEVKKEISANAPKRTGVYKKSWVTKKTKETSNSLTMTVHSKNRYQIAHLLEHGHAKRGGGRVAAIPHIVPAEEHGAILLQQKIERGLRE